MARWAKGFCVHVFLGKVALKWSGLEDSEMARFEHAVFTSLGMVALKRRGLEDFRDGWFGQGLCVHVFGQTVFRKVR
ncbi:hypothetical protein CEXT_198011 [Caerostris extrusa]|uniref:Uncharacterized protein n=1 Tax=Caerostris extrusa TaxID=172846 RepID=A0AAV4Q9P0_CAEEX|nr:hypothetical protein CEXT_198011 [Caerostris extrusa]